MAKRAALWGVYTVSPTKLETRIGTVKGHDEEKAMKNVYDKFKHLRGKEYIVKKLKD